MKHFANDRSSIVTEAIDATIALSNGALTRLDGYPSIKVVLRRDWDRSRVAVISGGGSGHEPAHVGFVGDGLLTAAVCGEIFASPSVDAVLAAILAVTSDAGCLLIVKNYTGDRLNFGLAAEKARALGRRVEMVIVGDDIALPESVHPRGIAGTLFVHKVAGHLARAGASLEQVRDGASRVASSVRSIGLSLNTCTIPGQPAEQRLAANEVELGLGIHGEPGAEKIEYQPMRALATVLAARLNEALGDTQRVAVLINDLGGVPPIEMAVATSSILGALDRDVSLVFGPARLMTSLDMKGLSVSALPLDDELEQALLSPVAAPAWAPGARPMEVTPTRLPEELRVRPHVPSADPVRRRVLEAICNELIAREAELNVLDAKVGDGDTGSTFASAARAVLADLDRLPLAEPAALCAAISERLSSVMGGSSGILLSIGVAAMGPAAPDWARALREGVRRIQQYGGAAEGDRTMLDALIPAIAALEGGRSIADAAAAASTGAERTASMLRARAGRSGYVPSDVLRGVPDPGAVAVAGMLAAIARA